MGASCQECTIMVNSCQERTRMGASCQEPVRTIRTIRKIKILPGPPGGLQDLGTQQFADEISELKEVNLLGKHSTAFLVKKA